MQTTLKPQDLVVLLRLSLGGDEVPTYVELANELGLVASQIHASVQRAQQAQLVFKDANGKIQIVRESLKQFVLYGARYVFPAARGELSRGIPTAYAASPLKEIIMASNEPPPVWPDKSGNVRGVALYPLYSNLPGAAVKNPPLYELLVLFDALRAGNARERSLAQDLLSARLSK